MPASMEHIFISSLKIGEINGFWMRQLPANVLYLSAFFVKDDGVHGLE
jgi:hypothetical protein